MFQLHWMVPLIPLIQEDDLNHQYPVTYWIPKSLTSPTLSHTGTSTSGTSTIFTQAPSNSLSIQEILQRIHLGIDLDEVAFHKSRIIFCNLQAIDRVKNPQFYNDSSDAVDKDSLSRFPEDRENEGEEEPQEEEDLDLPLQPTQDHHSLSRSESTLDFKLFLSALQPVPFQNDGQWEQFLNLEIERIFET